MDFRSGLRVLLLLLAALIVAVMLAFPATAYDLQQGDWNISPAYLGTIGFSVAATILFYFLCRKLWFWVYAIGLTLITASHVYVPYALWSRTRVDAQDGLVILLPWFTLFCCVTGAVVLLFIRQILQQVKQPSPSPVPNLSESPGTVSAADDQQRYINHASWGPLLGVLYFYRFGTKKILALYAIPAALWLLGFGLTVVEMALSFSVRLTTSPITAV